MIVDLTGFTTGVCDKLRQLTFCATVAYYRNEKVLKILEIPSKECPFYLIDLFRLDGFDFEKIHYNLNENIIMNASNSSITKSTVKQWIPFDIKVTIKDFLKKWKDIYAKIKPNKNILTNKEWDTVYKIGKNTIGIHIRTGDRLTSLPAKGGITKKQFNAFLKYKIPEIIKYANCNKYSVFLASDTYKADCKVRNMIKSKVNLIEYAKKWNSCGIRETEGEEFLLDLYGLSRTLEIFSTSGGGVPFTASLIAGKNTIPVHIWATHRLIDKIIIYLRVFSNSFSISKNIRLLFSLFSKKGINS